MGSRPTYHEERGKRQTESDRDSEVLNDSLAKYESLVREAAEIKLAMSKIEYQLNDSDFGGKSKEELPGELKVLYDQYIAAIRGAYREILKQGNFIYTYEVGGPKSEAIKLLGLHIDFTDVVTHNMGQGEEVLREKSDNAVELVVQHARDMAEKLLARLESTTDVLTGLPNRRLIAEVVENRIGDRNMDGYFGAMVLFDLDKFKICNDILGHQFGDEVLRQLGGFLAKHFRGGDIVARHGGEEFSLFISDLRSEKPSLNLEQDRDGNRGLIRTEAATRIKNAMQRLHNGLQGLKVEIPKKLLEKKGARESLLAAGKLLNIDGVDYYDVSASIGANLFRYDTADKGLNFGSLSETADKALYIGKENGRNRVVFTAQQEDLRDSLPKNIISSSEEKST